MDIPGICVDDEHAGLMLFFFFLSEVVTFMSNASVDARLYLRLMASFGIL